MPSSDIAARVFVDNEEGILSEVPKARNTSLQRALQEITEPEGRRMTRAVTLTG